jgi:hypothetical protein
MTIYYIRDWGGCDLTIDLKKIDLLPRFTLTQITGSLIINIGFLMLTFNLAIYDSEMREFNRKCRTGETQKELDEKIKEMVTQLKDISEDEEQ